MPTRSDAYKLARDVIIPELRRITSQFNGEQFRLREISLPLIENAIPLQDRDAIIPFQRSEGGESFLRTVKWYVYDFVRNDNFWVNLGGGNFRNQIEQDIDENELQESALEEGDESASEYDGWIYAYTFPSIKKIDESFPIKVGKTVNEVDLRVRDQVRGAALFENPIILAQWQVKRVAHTEMAIHYTLKARGLWIDDAPGREWFKTTLATINGIVENICQ
jgi:hypothetical protein